MSFFNFPNKLGEKKLTIRIPTDLLFGLKCHKETHTMLLQKKHDLFTKSVPVTTIFFSF